MSKLKKDQLIKGLGAAALLGGGGNSTPKPDITAVTLAVMVSIDSIEVNPHQPRKEFNEKALAELAESIKTYGIIQPLTVRRMSANAYQLISGERRLRASRMAGFTEVPAYLRTANDQEMVEMALVENIQRADLNPIEVANSYQRLIDEFLFDHEALGKRVGKSRSTVTNSLRLLKLPPSMQTALKEGKISTGHAKCLLSIEDIVFQSVMFKEIVEKELSVRALEDAIRIYNEKKEQIKERKNTPSVTPEMRTATDTLSAFFGTKIQLKQKNNGMGQITINFNSTEDLNRILDLIEN
jgi:ParB family chromosome partitioning protein